MVNSWQSWVFVTTNWFTPKAAVMFTTHKFPNTWLATILALAISVMCSPVLGVVCEHHQVLNSIVVPNTVYMMDDFSFGKKSPNVAFHNEPVLPDISCLVSEWMPRLKNFHISSPSHSPSAPVIGSQRRVVSNNFKSTFPAQIPSISRRIVLEDWLAACVADFIWDVHFENKNITVEHS